MRIYFRKYLTKSNYFYDIFLQGGGNLLAQIVSILSIPILTRLYSPSDFGEYNLFTTLVSFLTILISLRYEYLLVLAKDNTQTNRFIQEVLILGSINTLILILFFLIDSKVKFLPNINLKSSWIIFSPIAAFLLSISVLLQNNAQYNRNYSLSSLSEIYNKALSTLSSIVWFFCFRGSFGLAFGFTMGQFFKSLFLKIKSKNIFSFKLPLSFNLIKEHFRTALSFSIANFLLSFQTVILVIFLGNKYGSNVVGYWALMSTTLYLPSSLIGNAIGNVYNERIGKFKHKNKIRIRIWISTFKTLLTIGIPFFFMISVCSGFLFPLVFGKEWTAAGEYSKLFAIVAGLSFVATPLDRTCYITGKLNYPYVYGFLRLLFMTLNILYSIFFNLSFDHFLKLYVTQVSILYLLDLLMSYKFANSEFKTI